MINFAADQSWSSVAKWGYLPDSAIFDGAYWGLITGAFVHVDPIHLAFNMYWLFFLGGAMERAIGPVKWVVFVLAAAAVSSGLQLLSGSAGIGFSGVGYAMFGFAWLTRARFPEIARVANQGLFNLFVGWGLLCIVLTYLKVMNVGNFAHAGGLAFGALVGAWIVSPKRRPLTTVCLAVLVLGACASLFWNPMSVDWVGRRAHLAMVREEHPEAIRMNMRLLEIGGDPIWAWRNLAEIYGFQEDKARYKEAVQKLESLDSDVAQEVIKDYGDPD